MREREREFCKVQLMRRGGRIVEHSTSNETSLPFKEQRAIKGRLSNLELYIGMTRTKKINIDGAE